MLWFQIASLSGCQSVTLPKNYPGLFLFKVSEDDTGWLVGRYRDLTRLATDLRHDEELRAFLAANHVRLGLRDSDVPPAEIKRQQRYGTVVRGGNYNQVFTAARINPMAQPVHLGLAPAANRKTDREANVKGFWDSQTPQSHHIVEFNNLETLGLSRAVGGSELDYFQLPAVLLVAEFHQRYISAILKPAQQWSKQKLQSDMVANYRGLYLARSRLFKPLWQISQEVFKAAGIKVH